MYVWICNILRDSLLATAFCGLRVNCSGFGEMMIANESSSLKQISDHLLFLVFMEITFSCRACQVLENSKISNLNACFL